MRNQSSTTGGTRTEMEGFKQDAQNLCCLTSLCLPLSNSNTHVIIHNHTIPSCSTRPTRRWPCPSPNDSPPPPAPHTHTLYIFLFQALISVHLSLSLSLSLSHECPTWGAYISTQPCRNQLAGCGVYTKTHSDKTQLAGCPAASASFVVSACRFLI